MSARVMERSEAENAAPGFAQALGVWGRLGLMSFGGPAGQIALMHRMLVEERRWLNEAQFLRALNFCMLLPGPEAMQLATYAGWRLHGLRGGLAAGLLFVLPGAAIVLLLAAIYARFGQADLVAALFFGIKAAVLAIVVEALLRIARRALKTGGDWAIAAGAFVAIFILGVPFPLIVLASAVIGAVRASSRPEMEEGAGPPPAPISLRRTASTIATWLILWFAPLLAAAAILGGDHVLVEIGVFFSKLAVVTFGGAYAVLAYMAQAAVETHGWVTPGAMLDGLGLAETTPGPLILVTEFIGFLAAHGWQDGQSLWLGLAGALMTLWVTFAPCFLWVLAGAPYIESLARRPLLSAALAGITAAVVGVILNLALWFGLQVVFRDFAEFAIGPVGLSLPVPGSLEWRSLAVVAVAALCLFGTRMGVIATLAVSGLFGFALQWFL